MTSFESGRESFYLWAVGFLTTQKVFFHDREKNKIRNKSRIICESLQCVVASFLNIKREEICACVLVTFCHRSSSCREKNNVLKFLFNELFWKYSGMSWKLLEEDLEKSLLCLNNLFARCWILEMNVVFVENYDEEMNKTFLNNFRFQSQTLVPKEVSPKKNLSDQVLVQNFWFWNKLSSVK